MKLLARSLSLGLAVLAAWPAAALAEPRTVCTITINSPDERDVMMRQLPGADYRFVELVQHGQPDWFAQACRSGVRCDALVISGHFDDGSEFYTDRFENREALPVQDLQQASCSDSCGVFAQLKEVYLFGCNTLKTEPRRSAGSEVLRSLQRGGLSPDEAQRSAAKLGEHYGESNRERLRHIFKDVPLLYGFSSKAPLGRYAGPLLERVLQSAPPGEVASGRPSGALLAAFGPSSMVSARGVTDADPHIGLRNDICSLADERRGTAQKMAFVHQVLRRDAAEVRMLLDHLEHYLGTVSAAQRLRPDVAEAFDAIRRDLPARERFLDFARDADLAVVQSRMIDLARSLGWLTDAQQQDEFVRMITTRMARRDGIARHEVDLVCASPLSREGLLDRVTASGAADTAKVAHAAVLACLGASPAHDRTVRALTSARPDEVEIAQTYLRHRPLAGAGEVQAIAADIGRLAGTEAQVRALETLARQRVSDARSLEQITALFRRTRSLQVQRAIANVLLRADTQLLERGELAQSLRRHRLRSPDGQDVIDVLIRVLQRA
ncbi:hypothetical protein [Piscinibacter sp.]|uniref:hypothetical protein n=1 Tax=Piscinibacter sp. TaxID=1903157 RepID=UPI0039E4DA57